MTNAVKGCRTGGSGSGHRIGTSDSDNRLSWVDVAKGMGIILVVYGHALRGFWGSRPWPAWTVSHDTLIYAFHMPLFFMIAGLFLWQSIERGRVFFLQSRWWAVIYPYLLWSIVCGGIGVAASRFANTPMTTRDMLWIPIVPVQQFWFLYALFIVQLIAAACFPSRTGLVLATIVAVGVATFIEANKIFAVALGFLPFLTAGVWGAALIKRLSVASDRSQLATFGFSWLAFGAVYNIGFAEPWSRLLLGCLGSVGSLAAAMLISTFSASRGLAVLGRASMAIYVLHTLFSAGVRSAFLVLHVDRYAKWTLLPEFAIGLLLPVPLWLWSRAHPKGYLFGFGDRPPKQLPGILQPDSIGGRLVRS